MRTDPIDQDSLPDVQGGEHRPTGDLVWLDDERLDHKREADGDRCDQDQLETGPDARVPGFRHSWSSVSPAAPEESAPSASGSGSASASGSAQVVQLRPPHVAAGGHLDALDLRRVQWEGSLHSDAERLLAHGERLTHAVALALEDDPLEDLGAPPRSLHDLEVHADAIAGVEYRRPAQLRVLQAVDHGAHLEY
jgi:hypothetical protein